MSENDKESRGTMEQQHSCGPDGDGHFFSAINEVFGQYPDLAQKYAISCMDHETDIMGIDFGETIGVARIEGDTIVIRFQQRESVDSGLICCKWWRESDSTWTCLKRWDHAVVDPDPKVEGPQG